MKIENNLDSADIRGLVLRLALPSMLAQFVNVLYSIVDRMYIGNIKDTGVTALAGVGVCSPILTLISAFAFLVGAGGSPLMSIRLGERKTRDAEKVLANSFLLIVLISIVLMGISFLGKNYLLLWFGASEATFAYADEYISVYLTGTVFALISGGLNQFIICQGYAKKAMASVLLGAAINIILDPILIFVCGMGVGGAALATVIAQFCSAVYVLHILFGKNIPIRITFGAYERRIIGRILILGLSPFLVVASDSVLIIVLNSVIQRYGGIGEGDRLLACATIVQSFMLIITMPLGGITAGTQTILGYNYGARRIDRVWKAERNILMLTLLFTTVMFVAAHTVPQYFAAMFTRNPEYIKLSVWGIQVYTLGIIPLAVQYTVVDGLSGMGLAKYAITLSMFRKCLFLICVLMIPVCFSVQNVFFAEPVSDAMSAVTSGCFFLLYLRKILQRRLREPYETTGI